MNENVKLKNMFDYQLSELNNEEYKKYLKYLDIFYEKKRIDKKMDKKREDKYTREYIDNKYVLIDKTNPNKKIKITPSQFIDIHSLYIELKNSSDEILGKISLIIESNHNITDEDRKEFDDLKKKYVLFRDKIKDIDSINDIFYKEINKLINEKIEKSNELVNYYQKRNYEYSNITVMIKENIKNKFIQIFKKNNNKIPSTSSELSKIAKDSDISVIELEKWFKWIELSYFYILVQRDIHKIENDIIEKENNYEINTRFMIIKKYKVEIS